MSRPTRASFQIACLQNIALIAALPAGGAFSRARLRVSARRATGFHPSSRLRRTRLQGSVRLILPIALLLLFQHAAYAGIITLKVDPGARATLGLYTGLDQDRIFLESIDDDMNTGSVTFDVPRNIQRRTSKLIFGQLLGGKHLIYDLQLRPGERLAQIEPFVLPTFVPDSPDVDDLGVRFEGDLDALAGIDVGFSLAVIGGVAALLPQATFFTVDPLVDPFAARFIDPFGEPFEGSATVLGIASFAPHTVPEPSTLVLTTLGLAGVLSRGVKRRPHPLSSRKRPEEMRTRISRHNSLA